MVEMAQWVHAWVFVLDVPSRSILEERLLQRDHGSVPSAKMIDRQVRHEAIEPRRKSGLASIARHRPQEADHGVLRHVRSISGVPHHTERDAVDVALLA